ncbi:MAG TPA: PQQ-binding-like beta-propeller repeat protein [Acidobacteriota bacterium]|nr:PQQ-binding-like beta-propeller repeat protein [Acidobacteriota bacterium]
MASVTRGLFLLCLIVLVGGCSARYRLDRDMVSTGSPWPFARGGSEATGAVTHQAFRGKLDVIWSRRMGDKPAGPLTIYHEALIYPGTKKKARFFDIRTGRSLGSLKTKGVAQTGLVMQDSLAFFAVGPKPNRLYGIDLVNRKTIWKASVKDAAPGPIIVSNRLLISSGDGTVAAFDPASGERIWQFSAEGKFIASAAYGNGRLYQPDDRGLLHVLSLDDGREIIGIKTGGPLVNWVAVGDLLYATDMTGHVYAIGPETGEIVWRAALGQPTWTSPAAAGGRVFVGHSAGELVAFDAVTGGRLWTFDAGEVIKASPLVIDEYVVLGTLGGNLFLLDAADGSVIASQKVKGAIAFPPVTDGERVFVATQKGRVVCFGERYEQHKQTDH